jgi:putative hemolysin
MNPLIESARLLVSSQAHYAIRLTREAAAVRAAQALRYQVFNVELNEGLQASHTTGLDEDPFDPVCDHLLVEHLPSREVVGTYRLQTGPNAAAKRGYYCEQEFDFSVFEAARGKIIEVGRACVQQQHRNLVVLGMLWKGIADYATANGGGFVLGCSSLTSQDPAVGASAYADMCRKHLAPVEWRTKPLPNFDCPLTHLASESVKIPKLLRAYLTLGAKICGPPAIDRQFKTIDFLTLVDLEKMPPLARQRFFGA